MKIETLAQAVMPAVKPAGTAAAASWRQALELAQWQGRQRYQALPVMPSPAPAAAASTAEVSAPQLLQQQQAAPVRAQQAPHEDAHGSNGASKPEASAQPAIANALAPAPLKAAPGPASPPPRASLAWRAPLPAPAAPPPQAAPQAPPWPAFASHVSVSGNLVSAALRDASLEPQQAQALRRALVKQLGANGWQLAELRINGIALDN